MSDLQKYIQKRKARDKEFEKNFDSGYEHFKIGVLLKQAREESGLTQEELALRLNTKKSAISRIENHAEDIKFYSDPDYPRVAGEVDKKVLHIIWLVDNSGDMSGGKIHGVNYVTKEMIKEFQTVAKKDKAHEIVFRVIQFSSPASWHLGSLTDATPVDKVNWTDMRASGGTDMAGAINILADAMDDESSSKRAWAWPVILMISGGYSNNNIDAAMAKLNRTKAGRTPYRFSIGIGNDGDYDVEQLRLFVSNKYRDNPDIGVLRANNAKTLMNVVKIASLTPIQASGFPQKFDPIEEHMKAASSKDQWAI